VDIPESKKLYRVWFRVFCRFGETTKRSKLRIMKSTDDIATRATEAQSLWAAGDRALAGGRLDEAWQLYTDAHDRIVDCPALHRQAHRKLQAVNRLNGHRGEWLTDTVLLALAPFAVFEAIALLFRSKVTGAEQCRRSQPVA
jgi:hypothetical protein